MRWLVLALILLAGCTEPASEGDTETQTTTTVSTTATTEPGTPGPTTHQVAISGFRFVPANLEVAVGDTVVWTNDDSASHTVDSTDGGPLDSGTLRQGDTFQFTFTSEGTFPYQCDLHPSMQGQIIVS